MFLGSVQDQSVSQEVPSAHQEALLHCEGDGALPQVAQRSCGLSTLVGTQKQPGRGPGQPALGGSA